MQKVNQNQYEVIQLEKETVMLAVKVLQEKYNRQFDLFSLLKFFIGFYLNNDDIHHCVETLESIDEYINKYNKFLTNQNYIYSYTLDICDYTISIITCSKDEKCFMQIDNTGEAKCYIAIKYLHQIQNAIYFTTGNELNVNKLS